MSFLRSCVYALLLLLPAPVISQSPRADRVADARRADERLSFQSGQPWTPRTNLNADLAMVYGIGPQMLPNLQSWQQRGYKVAVMTGVAWGRYQDYLDGRFDGVNHLDQSQTDANGNVILHGGSKDIAYISPGASYGQYLTQGIKRALDGGAESIFLEEPEFWASSGWEENFKREWKAYYGEDWTPPNSSPDAQYRASQLKYFLYRRALKQVFDYVREYGKANGRVIPCYVAAHSLINYANWRIVSPESSLLAVGADGYIAQIWTGTARTPNFYDGVSKERTFETAFLEYGSMQNLARASGKRIWYLNDPIEDDPNHDWDDYRSNWESTLTASLLQPDVWRYEIVPWPERVFNSKHPVKTAITNGKSEQELEQPNVEKVGIPKSYETELQSVFNALADMKQSDVEWLAAGTKGVGVLVSDTMMFERADPSPSDASLGSFYGLALPLVKHGVPAEPVQIETSTDSGSLNRYQILVLTYEGQKPPKPEFHNTLAEWVRGGGALVVVDNDDDPYNSVREWWNQAPNSYKTPREDLFAKLGIPLDAQGLYHVGKGVVLSERDSPAALTYRKDGAETVLGFVRQAAAAVSLSWKETNAMVLRRGPYVVAAGLDESVPGAMPYVFHGSFVNLFDADLPVVHEVTLEPDARVLLVDLDRIKANVPKVIAASCRIRSEQASTNSLTFEADGIADTNAVIRIKTGKRPSRATVGGTAIPVTDYDPASGTLLIRFKNSIDPLRIQVEFAS